MALTQTVPIEQFTASQARVRELEETVANSVPAQKFQELEAAMSQMVPNSEFASSQARVQELETKLANSVPVERYSALEQEFSRTVPREQLLMSAAKIVELEAKLADTVPTRDYDDLTATIVSLTRGASQSTFRETPAEQPKSEISEIQSGLAEIKGAADSGQTTFETTPEVVDGSQGFVFGTTGICAKSGLEFLDDLEHVPVEILESHSRNGDFERWFNDVLADEASASSLRTIRESNVAGEELKSQIVAVIAPRYRS